MSPVIPLPRAWIFIPHVPHAQHKATPHIPHIPHNPLTHCIPQELVVSCLCLDATFRRNLPESLPTQNIVVQADNLDVRIQLP